MINHEKEEPYMKIEKLIKRSNLPPETQQVLKKKGIIELNPMQSKAIKQGLLDEGSYVVTAPTSSGKTLLAELLTIKKTIKDKQKALYICPLRALATEQHKNFKEKYSSLGMKTALSIGDYDEKDSRLNDYDLIVASYEKADSLIRHNPDWIKDIGLLIIDEIQNIDSDRGPTLEVLISKIKERKPKTEIIALSATVPNSEEIAKWINAKAIKSNYRPVPLYEGIYYDNLVRFKDKKNRKIKSDERRSLNQVIEETLSRNEQAIVFSNTRKNCESNAKKLSKLTEPEANKVKLREISEEVKNALSKPTEQCKKLSKAIKKGTAFHHAGLVRKQRRKIEEAYEKGLIKVIVATPTLAAGINLPTKRVIMNSMYMYTGKGSQLIPTNKYKQRAGRAGRPQFDDYGESVIIARKEQETNEFKERYLEGSLEKVESQLGFEPVLRSHVLSIICDICQNKRDLKNFFSKTFYGETYGTTTQLSNLLNQITSDLESWGFIKKDKSKIEPTLPGKRVSELYIDPLSAHRIIDSLNKTKNPGEIGYLFMVADTQEMKPYLKVQRKEEPTLWEEARSHEDEIMRELTGYDLGTDFLNKYKLTKLFKEWVNEKPEDKILEQYGVPPGIMRGYLSNADWILYSSIELAKLTDNKNQVKHLSKIRRRMKQGIKEELLPLTDIRGIGRVRSRKLFEKGIKKPSDVKKTPYKALSKILGPKIAKNTKERLGQEVNETIKENKKPNGQRTIAEY